jgi:hypothetical protein
LPERKARKVDTEYRALADLGNAATKMSLAERVFYSNGYLLLNDDPMLKSAKVHTLFYEGISFAVPGGSYKPDFDVFMSDGGVVFVEIKESKFAKGYRDSRSKLRAVASLFPMFHFMMARYKRSNGTWDIEHIMSDGMGWSNGCIEKQEREGSGSREDQAGKV